MPEPRPLAIVGCGGIAQAYLQALGDSPFRVIAAVDPDPARLQALATRPGLARHASLQELLAARQQGARLDAALVLTPPDTHEAISTALLRAGVHVLCEKPLAPSPAAAERMVEAAATAGRVLMMGSKFRYTQDIVRARRLLDERIVGDVLLFENVFCSHVDMTGRWNSNPAIAGGGVLIDNGCHSVDLARYLLGPIARVQAWFPRRVQPLPVEDTARLMFESQQGAMGTIDLSWSLHKEVTSYVRVYGSRGTLEVGWKQSRWKRQGERDWTGFGHGYDKVAAFAAQLADFARAIGGGGSEITTADALASVQVIDLAYRSAAGQHWLELDQ
ncbi:MAG: Gfo/Idh/MocA family oxidoreductase [Planctomycetes bacterium]|nr:Gfo/Idh/MocA family oxidoreductase [Planctomycetota bacterium]